MPGLSFAPSKVQKFKNTPWARKKASVKSKAEAERVRKSNQLERQRKREERLKRRTERREEEKQLRAQRNEPPVTKAKSKRDPRRHHGSEQVDDIILRLLGKSRKSKKVTGKGKQSVVGRQVRVETQQETYWKPGMREEAGERMQKMKRKMQRRRLVRKAKAERKNRKETRVLVGELLSDLLTSLPGSGKEKMPHPDSDEAEGINDVGSDLEVDLKWNPLEAERVETPDFPSSIIHPKPSYSPIHPKPSFCSIHPSTIIQAEEKQSKLVPIVDVGPDYEADGELCSSGVNVEATELAWPLPIQAPLQPMPPCMEFFQVGRQ